MALVLSKNKWENEIVQTDSVRSSIWYIWTKTSRCCVTSLARLPRPTCWVTMMGTWARARVRVCARACVYGTAHRRFPALCKRSLLPKAWPPELLLTNTSRKVPESISWFMVLARTRAGEPASVGRTGALNRGGNAHARSRVCKYIYVLRSKAPSVNCVLFRKNLHTAYFTQKHQASPGTDAAADLKHGNGPGTTCPAENVKLFLVNRLRFAQREHSNL